jgi:hypothetical protein
MAFQGCLGADFGLLGALNFSKIAVKIGRIWVRFKKSIFF